MDTSTCVHPARLPTVLALMQSPRLEINPGGVYPP